MQGDLFYPDVPGWKARDTSEAAAVEVKSRAATLRDKALEILRAHGPLTADEVADRMGEGILSIRPRISELAAVTLVFDTGERRENSSGKKAIVWRVA